MGLCPYTQLDLVGRNTLPHSSTVSSSRPLSRRLCSLADMVLAWSSTRCLNAAMCSVLRDQAEYKKSLRSERQSFSFSSVLKGSVSNTATFSKTDQHSRPTRLPLSGKSTYGSGKRRLCYRTCNPFSTLEKLKLCLSDRKLFLFHASFSFEKALFPTRLPLSGKSTYGSGKRRLCYRTCRPKKQRQCHQQKLQPRQEQGHAKASQLCRRWKQRRVPHQTGMNDLLDDDSVDSAARISRVLAAVISTQT
jgi:hypothetical protein